jgi:hypothetical protein
MKFDVISFKDNPDGSGTMVIDFDNESLIAFAKIGILKVLTDEAERINKEHEKVSE